jgi:hypothetical protein
MALKDYLGVINNALKSVFDRKPVDPTKARRPLLRGIDRTLAQFKNGSKGTPSGWYQLKNGVVALTVKVAGDTFDINGVATSSRSSSSGCAPRSRVASSTLSWPTTGTATPGFL